MWTRISFISIIFLLKLANSSELPTISFQDSTQSDTSTQDSQSSQTPTNSQSQQHNQEENSTNTTTSNNETNQQSNSETLSVSQISCPKLTCQDTQNTICLQVSSTQLIRSPCPVDTYCPFYSLKSPTSTNCQSQKPQSLPAHDCYAYRTQDESCSNSDDQYCDSGLYCPNQQNAKCKKKIRSGKSCSQTDSCQIGYVCSNGKCVQYFSVAEGESATTKVACASNILKDKICQPPQETRGSLPRKCLTDDDCESVQGDQGTCACGYDQDGTAYCQPHNSDEIVKDWTSTYYDGAMASYVYKTRKVTEYPAFHNTPDCFEGKAKEIKELKILKDTAEECFGWVFGYGVAVLGLI